MVIFIGFFLLQTSNSAIWFTGFVYQCRSVLENTKVTTSLSSFPPAISTCWLHKHNSYQSSRELSWTYQQWAGVITKFSQHLNDNSFITNIKFCNMIHRFCLPMPFRFRKHKGHDLDYDVKIMMSQQRLSRIVTSTFSRKHTNIDVSVFTFDLRMINMSSECEYD
jgi:hypothetical protein